MCNLSSAPFDPAPLTDQQKLYGLALLWKSGTTGSQIKFALPGDGSFRICSKRAAYADGREFVGPGMTPDIYVPSTPEILRSGKDLVLDLAVAELEKRKP